MRQECLLSLPPLAGLVIGLLLRLESHTNIKDPPRNFPDPVNKVHKVDLLWWKQHRGQEPLPTPRSPGPASP